MTERHKKALEELIKLHESNPDNIALIICGSIARQEAGNNSDIDLYLVVKNDATNQVKKTKTFFRRLEPG